MSNLKDVSSYGVIRSKELYSSLLKGAKASGSDTFADLRLRAYNTNESKYTTVTLSVQGDIPKLTLSSTGVAGSPNTVISGVATPAISSDVATKGYVDTSLTNKITNVFTAKNQLIKSTDTTNYDVISVPVNTGDVLTYDGVTDDLKWLSPQAGIASLHGLQDVLTDEPPADKSFLMYNPSNGSGVANFWVNSTAAIADITGLQTSLDTLQTNINGKISTTTLTTNGDLLVRTAGVPSRLGVGTNGQLLTMVAGAPAWSNQNIAFPLLGTAGSAAAPTYSFAGATNTGMYRQGTAQLNFALGGGDNYWMNTFGLQAFNNTVFQSTLRDSTKPSFGAGNGGTSCTSGMYIANTFNNVGFSVNNVGQLDTSAIRTKLENRLDIKNTQISDDKVSISNTTNTFSFNNAANTTTFLYIDVANDLVKLPRNSWTMAYLQEVTLSKQINSVNTFVFFNFGNTADGLAVVQPAAAKNAFTWDNGNSRFQIATAGTYHVNARITILGSAAVNPCDICMFNPVDSTVFAGSISSNTIANGNYYNFNMDFIATVTTSNTMGFAMRVPTGTTLPYGFTVKGWSVTTTNLLTS